MFLEFNKDNIKYEVVDTFIGGSLKGTVYTTYGKLNELFGEPTVNDANPNEKVNMEWVIEGKVYFTDEYGEEDWEYVKATVYNWKTGSVPLGEYGWHIGGDSYESVELIDAIIENNIKAEYNYNERLFADLT